MSARSRSGFTLVELVVVLLIVNLLAAISLPNLRRAVLRARAAEAAGDRRVVQVAVLNYQADHHRWPAGGYAGETPPSIASYLPEGFSFATDEYELDYDEHPDRTPGLIGVALMTEDEELRLMVRELLGDSNTWLSGEKITWVIQWVDEG